MARVQIGKAGPVVDSRALLGVQHALERHEHAVLDARRKSLADERQTNQRGDQVEQPHTDLALWEIIETGRAVAPMIGLEDETQITPDAIAEQLMPAQHPLEPTGKARPNPGRVETVTLLPWRLSISVIRRKVQNHYKGFCAMKAFFSHASEDKEIVEQVYKRIIARFPEIEGWLDIYEIIGGEDLIEKLAAGIDSVDRFLIFLSDRSIDKPWVKPLTA